jgi:hypothetical protein
MTVGRRTSKMWCHVLGALMRALRATIVSLALMLFLAAGCGVGDADKDAGIAGPNASSRPGEATRERSADNRPNIMFVMTDDMDEKMLARMPADRLRLADGHPERTEPETKVPHPRLRGRQDHNPDLRAVEDRGAGALRPAERPVRVGEHRRQG